MTSIKSNDKIKEKLSSKLSMKVSSKTKWLKLIRFWLFNTDYWECCRCKTINGNLRIFCGNCGELVKIE